MRASPSNIGVAFIVCRASVVEQEPSVDVVTDRADALKYLGRGKVLRQYADLNPSLRTNLLRRVFKIRLLSGNQDRNYPSSRSLVGERCAGTLRGSRDQGPRAIVLSVDHRSPFPRGESLCSPSGVPAQIALAQEGTNVVIVGWTREALHEVADEVKDAGAAIRCVQESVADRETAARAV